MIKEIDSLKEELAEAKSEKLELETNIEDLKQTLKLTEKESQVILKIQILYVYHIFLIYFTYYSIISN